MDWLKKHWHSVVLAIIVLVLTGFMVHLYNKVPDYAGKVVVATPAPEVANVPQVDAPIKTGKVRVYSGSAKTKEKLTLPKPVVEDDKQQVIASSKIEPSENPHTVTTVINTDTGASETYVRTDPLPWLAYSSRGAVGMYYGLKNGDSAVRLQARQDIVQIKAVRFGVMASVDQTFSTSKTDTFVGVGLSYNW